MELYKAHNQWSTRPNDERYWSLADAGKAANELRQSAREKVVSMSDLRVEAFGDDIKVVGRAGVPATLTNWSFKQLAKRAAAPASYLQTLPATLASQNINYGLKAAGGDDVNLLFHKNGDMVLRSATSDRYARIWNDEIVDRLLDLPGSWRPAPARPSDDGDVRARPATKDDIFGGTFVKEGDMIAPAGIYLSDHDCFFFLLSETTISDGTDDPLRRGIMVWNSEVGASAFGFMRFSYKNVCSNHIVWGASNVSEMRVRHVGTAENKAFGKLDVEMTRYSNESANDEEGKIVAAQKRVFGADREDVLAAVFGLTRKKRIDISQKLIGQAYDRAEERTDRYGAPNTAWGFVNGLTELSQETPFADERTKIDIAAGKILEAVF